MFQLVAVGLSDGLSASHLEEQSFGPDQLKLFKFQNAEERLDVLAKLPEAISATRTDKELAQAAIKVIARRDAACPRRGLCAIPAKHVGGRRTTDDAVGTAERMTSGVSSPSRRLIHAAIDRAEGILHVWQDTDDSNPAFTVTGNLDWAFCIPFKGDHSKGWALYVSGQFGAPGASAIGESDLKGDLRFTELICDLIGSIRQVKTLESQQAGLAQFFSPAVIEAVRTAGGEDILEPREADISILFCDVRGFSKKSEEAKDLRELLDRVSEALGVMTAGIIRYDGVIADFQGDAALGFWGWPGDSEEGPVAACRAAIHIHQSFRNANNHPENPLCGFSVGVGISHGRAIAGRIGTTEQIKVGAFGPVVNMGARLETMSKQLRASIVIDEVTASYVQKLPDSDLRCRKLARVRPVGMKTDMTVFELLPPVAQDDTVSDDTVAVYNQAVDAFISGDWTNSTELLNRVPADDKTKEFLLEFAAANNNQPPQDWAGVIHMTRK